jgi:hypothetical protein
VFCKHISLHNESAFKFSAKYKVQSLNGLYFEVGDGQSTVAEHFKDGGNFFFLDLMNFGLVAKDSKYSDWTVSVVSSGREKHTHTHTQEHGNVRSPLLCLRNEGKLENNIVVYPYYFSS